MDDKTGDAVDWLLSSAEPAVRLLARREPAAWEAALRTAELFLDHRLFRSLTTRHERTP